MSDYHEIILTETGSKEVKYVFSKKRNKRCYQMIGVEGVKAFRTFERESTPYFLISEQDTYLDNLTREQAHIVGEIIIALFEMNTSAKLGTFGYGSTALVLWICR